MSITRGLTRTVSSVIAFLGTVAIRVRQFVPIPPSPLTAELHTEPMAAADLRSDPMLIGGLTADDMTTAELRRIE